MNEDRFMNRVVVTPGCWIWVGPKSTGGYGRVSVSGVNSYAHRVAYELFVGAIPPGYEVDHTCKNRPFVNAENMKRTRGVPRYKSTLGQECRNGHPRSPENVGVNAAGSRFCRPCKREQHPRSRAKERVSL